MTNKYVYLSYLIDQNVQSYGTHPAPQITPYRSLVKGDSCNMYSISTHNHCGTHVDAPAHFTRTGKKIGEYAAHELIFDNIVVLDIPKKPGEWIEKEDIVKSEFKGTECLLIRTGFGEFRGQEIYKANNPGISPETITWLRHQIKTMRCIGIDTISISGIQNRERGRNAHAVAFENTENISKPLLLLEDLNLSIIQPNWKIKKIIIAPWLIAHIDSAPCTVIAEVAGV